MMDESQENATALEKVGGSTAKFLLSKPVDSCSSDGGERTKIAIVGCGPVGVAVGISVLFKRLAAEVVFIDEDEEVAKAHAEDMAHAAVFLGSPKIRGTKDFAGARDAAVCVITVGRQVPDQYADLEKNVLHFKCVVPCVTKYAPNSVLIVTSSPVDILSYVAMKLSGFPPNRVIGLGTLLDNCRLQHMVSKELGLSAASVQSLVIGESGPTSVPIWSSMSVMNMRLKDIDKDIGGKNDPERWDTLHTKVVNCSKDMIMRKGHHCWAAAICTCEIIDAILRNTCACMTVSTFVKGCRHGLEKDVFMSLPCVVGRAGVLSYMRHLYTPEEQELTTRSSRTIYEAQKFIFDQLEQ
ncbi:L-lactate dehydrogenase [Copidosoma floridanum]|uniref:L-lactate dehydrogenase n=1 Tax=Copidosoma floridanum TaxID=29053 RepID=UPI0006C9B6C2|nr:L-lactate dehydrogenase [Copidosoma floridanum]